MMSKLCQITPLKIHKSPSKWQVPYTSVTLYYLDNCNVDDLLLFGYKRWKSSYDYDPVEIACPISTYTKWSTSICWYCLICWVMLIVIAQMRWVGVFKLAKICFVWRVWIESVQILNFWEFNCQINLNSQSYT